jgi:serine/threonine-protein kinase
MGEVFRAHDTVLDRQVAIKVLHRSLSGDPGFIERFRREARAAAGISHPNIVAVHDWGAVDGIYFMVMEYIAGQSLRELLNAHGRLEPAQVAEVIDQVLAALGHAHGRGIVHRDIKPENIMITPEGIAKVADFGLARAYAEGRQTSTGTVTGTVQYLAPEQIRGEPADPRTDLYSLGIVSFELLTGRLPFTGETAMAIAYKHLSNRVPAPSKIVPGLPRGIDGFVSSATERDRELRPESAGEMRRDLGREAALLPVAPPLGAIVDDQAAIVVPEAGPEHADTVTIPRAGGIDDEPVRRRRWPRRLLATIALLGLIAAAAYGAWEELIPHYHDVPETTGADVTRARERLVELGYVVVLEDPRFSDRIPAGRALGTEPAAGTRLEEGATIRLIPSAGPPPERVPEVIDLPRQRAERALTEAGFEIGRVTSAFSERIAEGRVIRRRPASAQAPRGSQIALVVSKGPAPRPVPPVVGSDLAEATGALQAEGFEVRVVEEFSQSAPRGSVMGQTPTASTTRPYGSLVTLTVSKGPARFALGDYRGMTEAEAVAALQRAGLVADVRRVPNAERDVVRGQDPKPGTTVRSGMTIVIFIG